jgi:hypothetical protein
VSVAAQALFPLRPLRLCVSASLRFKKNFNCIVPAKILHFSPAATSRENHLPMTHPIL